MITFGIHNYDIFMHRMTENDHMNNVESVLIPTSKLEELLAHADNSSVLIQIHSHSLSTVDQVFIIIIIISIIMHIISLFTLIRAFLSDRHSRW